MRHQFAFMMSALLLSGCGMSSGSQPIRHEPRDVEAFMLMAIPKTMTLDIAAHVALLSGDALGAASLIQWKVVFWADARPFHRPVITKRTYER